jgi:hypothetical protein
MSSAPRPRVVASVAGLAVLALGAGFFFLTRGQESSSAAPVTAQELVKRAAAKRNTPARTAPKPAAKRPVRAAAKPQHGPGEGARGSREVPPTQKRMPKVVTKDGLPSSIASALQSREVVVVSLYAPNLPLDDMALQEARTGAAAVGAGFVALNVLNESQARPLAELLGTLEDPAVLVFKRPGDVYLRLPGFADQQTVAQAAANAAL